jgi:DNA-directed RNA polymerase III subunit RPC6
MDMDDDYGMEDVKVPLQQQSRLSDKQLQDEISRRILQTCTRYPDGISESEMKADLKQVGLNNDHARAQAVNDLLRRRRLRVYREPPNDTLIFKAVSQEEAAKFDGLSHEDMSVFQIIERGENKGVWLKDIKFRTKFQPAQINAALKKLKEKNLIKPVKTIHGKNKIVYMLANLEPSREITGGVWYTGTEFNSALIQTLQTETCNYVFSAKSTTAADVLNHLRKGGFSANLDFREEDVVTLLNTLIYDGLVEEAIGNTSVKTHYKPSGVIPSSNAFSAIPCSTCPVFDQCTDEGDINPRGCPYLKTWMEIDF